MPKFILKNKYWIAAYLIAAFILLYYRKRIQTEVKMATSENKSFLGQDNLPRGIKNNNPGNLILTDIPWRGKIPKEQNTDENKKFEQFTSWVWGVRAKLKDIYGDITKKGQNTIRKLITSYAPAFENNTTAYINFVSQRTGIAPDAVLTADKETLWKLSRAIFEQENGSVHLPKYTRQDFENAFNLM